MDAEDLLLRQFLGILKADELEQAARWIRTQQRADGTWATFEGGPGNLSTTIEAYAALRLAGDDPAAPHMRAARAFVLAEGGIEASRVFTRIWLALFGEWSWDALPAMPPELVLLPSWAPLNVYDWACWARQTVVPITVVATLRPVRPLPFTLSELRTGAAAPPAAARPDRRRLQRRSTRRSSSTSARRSSPAAAFAMRQAAEWIIARQEDDGGWGGIQPPWVYSILALHLLGYPLDHPVLAAADLRPRPVPGARADARGHRCAGSRPASRRCGTPAWPSPRCSTPASRRRRPAAHARSSGCSARRSARRGDWAVQPPRTSSPPAGPSSSPTTATPTSTTPPRSCSPCDRVKDGLPGVKAASRPRHRLDQSACSPATAAGRAFDADNTRRLVEKLPFCDFGAVIDPPSADVTAHVVEMLGALRRRRDDAADLRRGVQWLLDAQEADGSWFGRWGTNYVYGTGAVVPALVAAGIDPDDPVDPPRRRLARASTRTPTAGGARTCAPTSTTRGAAAASPPRRRRRGRCSRCSRRASPAHGGHRARHRATSSRPSAPDGGWDEEPFTGTGFPGDFYISYEMYRLVFPLSALGRYVRAG